MRRIVLVAALGLAACGETAAPISQPQSTSSASDEGADGFNLKDAELLRPCSLVTVQELQRIVGKPLSRMMATDRVLGPQTTCTAGMGAAGVDAVAQLTVVHGDGVLQPDALFAKRCAAETGAVAQSFGDAPGCRTVAGLLIARLKDVNLEVSVQDGVGAVEEAPSLALMQLALERARQLESKP
jgi:hypothetical protein